MGPRRLAVLCLVVLLGACARKVTRDEVDPLAPLAGFPMVPGTADAVRAWYWKKADLRSSSLDLDGPQPYVETALSPGSPVERVGFFLTGPDLHVAAVLRFLRPGDLAPAMRADPALQLWGVPFHVTTTGTDRYAPALHALLKVLDERWQAPAEPRVALPGDVPLKTPTRTFHRDHLFAAEGGRLWFKRNPAHQGRVGEPWRLFGEGLPAVAPGSPPFVRPTRIEAVLADGDDLVALDAGGRAWVCTTESESSSSVSGWSDKWGFPGRAQLELDERAQGARALALGRRAEHASWFEDAIGNRHSYRPMGTTTFYALHRDGQELLFTDNGLPNDFSRDLCGPDDGRFVAEALSTSASALMLIDRFGRVATRFEDYDLNGGTPNFEYTYRSAMRPDDDGSSLGSAFSPYYLPLAPWRWHPPLPLTGPARASRRITILQTGPGNAARELRVGGRGPDGEPGYWAQAIEDEAWRFVADARAEVPPADLLDPIDVERGAAEFTRTGGDLARSSLPRGKSYRAHWEGTLTLGATDDAKPLPDVRLELDWNPYCPPGTLTVRQGALAFPVTLHTVDSWTPVRRGRPGYDGTPLLLLGTLVFDDAVLTDQRPALRRLVQTLRPYHQQNFALVVAMLNDHLELRALDEGVGERHPVTLRLTRTGDFAPPDPVVTGKDAAHGSIEWLKSTEVRDLANRPEFVIDAQHAAVEAVHGCLSAIHELRDALQVMLLRHAEQARALEDFLHSIRLLRPVVPLVAIGRVPLLPKLLSLQWAQGLLVFVDTETHWRAVDDVLRTREAEYRRALVERGLEVATPGR